MEVGDVGGVSGLELFTLSRPPVITIDQKPFETLSSNRTVHSKKSCTAPDKPPEAEAGTARQEIAIAIQQKTAIIFLDTFKKITTRRLL